MLEVNDPQVLKLAARVAEPIETPADLALAEECLDSAWEWVRSYGLLEWDHNSPSTPGIARTVALSAAARCFQNPSGFISERGDSVAFERGPDFAAGAELTVQEINALKRANRTSVSSITSLQMINPTMYPPRSNATRRRHGVVAREVGVGDPDHRTISFYDWG